MKNESSHLVAGLLFGAAIGACATYLVFRNKSAIEKELEEVKEKVKHGIHGFAEKARERAEELGNRTKEKTE